MLNDVILLYAVAMFVFLSVNFWQICLPGVVSACSLQTIWWRRDSCWWHYNWHWQSVWVRWFSVFTIISIIIIIIIIIRGCQFQTLSYLCMEQSACWLALTRLLEELFQNKLNWLHICCSGKLIYALLMTLLYNYRARILVQFRSEKRLLCTEFAVNYAAVRL